jgi:PadR family transcriptional regulator, regulatory protein PadR
MMEKKVDLWQGRLALLTLKPLALEPLRSLGVWRRIEQTTTGSLQVKPGSLFPALGGMEEAGWLSSFRGESENNRRSKFYQLTRAGQRQLKTEALGWQHISMVIVSALQTT